MMDMPAHEPGTFCSPELATNDRIAAQDFYTGLFGWTAEERALDSGGLYVALTSDNGGVVAAIATPRPELPNPPCWLSFIAVADVDGTASMVQGLGGSALVKPHDVEAGRVAILLDPAGAVFGVRQAADTGVRTPREPGTLAWTELVSPDAGAARDFYSRLFGWGVELRPTTFSPEPYTNFTRGGRQVGGMIQLSARVMPPQWLPYFGTPNADAASAKAEALGGTTIVPPSDVVGGRFAILHDPQGAPLGVIAAAGRL
jgi:predicted enzyme related to lactoylglutathione lyase